LRSALHRPCRLAAAVLAALAARLPPPNRRSQRPRSPRPLPGFVWRPQLSLTPMYDDNIYALPADTIADWVWVVSPTLSAESQWDTHRLRFEAGAELGRYDEYTSEDYDDWWVNADGRFDLAPGSNLFGRPGVLAGARGPRLAGRRGAGRDAGGDSRRAHGLHRPHRPGRRRAPPRRHPAARRRHLRAARLRRRPQPRGSTIDSDYRDRRVLGLALRLSRPLDERRDLFVQALWNQRRYDETPDAYGYYRDSDGYRLAVGLKGQLARGLEAEGYVGYLRQDYEDARFDTVSAPDFAGKINWRTGPRTGVRLTLERSVNETTLEGSSSYLYTNLAGSVAHQLDDRTTLNANLGAGLVAYQDVGRDDWIYTAGVSAQYRSSRRSTSPSGTAGSVATRTRAETAFFGADPFDYDRQQVYLTITVLDSF